MFFINRNLPHWKAGTVPRATAARPSHKSAACLRARCCTNLTCFDL